MKYVLIVCVLCLAACGGNDPSAPAALALQQPDPPPVSLGGYWTSGTAIMLSTASGEFFQIYPQEGAPILITSGNIQASGSTVEGSYSFAHVSPSGCQGEDICLNQGTDTVSGTIGSQSITLNGTTWTFNALYDQPSSLSAISGNWQGTMQATASGGGVLNITTGGEIFEQDPNSNCVISGLVTLIDSSYNAYGVALSYNGTDCDPDLIGVTATGLATLTAPGSMQIIVILNDGYLADYTETLD